MIAPLEQPYTGSTRTWYRRTLLETARTDQRILCLDSDMGGLEDEFAAELPEQYLNLGIAEANLMGVAAGLAKMGKIPFVNTMASFATLRAGEQVKLDIAENDLPVKIVATHAGISAGHFGSTHFSLEDLAIMRAMPNMTVVIPADPIETILAIQAIVNFPGPAYVRLGRHETAQIYTAPYDFRIGQAVLLREGCDVTVATCGVYPTTIALQAWERLKTLKINARILNFHTLKPLDMEAIIAAAEETGGIIIVEEHGPSGGLGSAVAETVCEFAPCRLFRITLPDEIRDCVGDQQYLLKAGGITEENIVNASVKLLSR